MSFVLFEGEDCRVDGVLVTLCRCEAEAAASKCLCSRDPAAVFQAVLGRVGVSGSMQA